MGMGKMKEGGKSKKGKSKRGKKRYSKGKRGSKRAVNLIRSAQRLTSTLMAQNRYASATKSALSHYTFGGKKANCTTYTCNVTVQTGVNENGNKTAFAFFESDVAQTVSNLRMKGSVFPIIRGNSNTPDYNVMKIFNLGIVHMPKGQEPSDVLASWNAPPISFTFQGSEAPADQALAVENEQAQSGKRKAEIPVDAINYAKRLKTYIDDPTGDAMIQEADTYQEIMGNDEAGDVDVPDIVNNGRGDFTQIYYPRKYLALADSGSCMWQEGAVLQYDVKCSAPQSIDMESGSNLVIVLASAFQDTDARVTGNFIMEFDVSN